MEGWLHVVWDGAASELRPDGRAYLLVDENGAATSLDLSGYAVAGSDGALELDRRRVRVRGRVRQAVSAAAGDPILSVSGIDALEPPRVVGHDGRFGAVASPIPFITLLCRFADDPGTPFALADVERMIGPTYPGAADMYGEMSLVPTVMAGNQVAGWYDLPLPRSSYVEGQNTNFSALVRDCTQAADPFVFFPGYFGINLQFNGNLSTRSAPPHDTLSFGGGWTMARDGQTLSYGITWLSRAHSRNYVVYTHEMGHAVGWPHSSGRYGQEYDSGWDLMSRGYLNPTPQFGYLGIHTIAPHKRYSGWIPRERIWEPPPGTRTSGVIERSALPSGGGGYLMAWIPTGTTSAYSVETRRIAGYDARLPAQAVLIHDVVRGLRSYVVDPDLDGDPNDDAAQWSPGETFADWSVGVSVAVTAPTATGFQVTITRGWPLDVTKVGPGRVTGSTGGIDCGAQCGYVSPVHGTPVSLSAHPDPGALFLGWGGACEGTEGCSVTLDHARTVTASFGLPLTIVSDSARVSASMGAPYEDTLRAQGGAGTPIWKVSAGRLPRGLAVDSLKGVITGIPEEAGLFAFTISARSAALTATRAFGLLVRKPVLQTAAVLDQLIGTGSLGEDQQRFLDLLGNRNGRMDVGDVRAWLVDSGQLSAPAAAGAVVGEAGGRR